jgi:hypothetical protein
VAVGADQRIREGDRPAVHLARPHCLREVLEVHLMTDAGAGRHDPEVLERSLSPAQETVAFAIAPHLKIDVGLERAIVAELVDHHRVIDHQVDR